MPPIRSLIMSASLKTSEFETGAKKMQGSLKEIGSTTKTIQASISGFGTSMIAAGAAAAAGALSIGAMRSALDTLIATSAKTQALNQAFTVIAGSAAAGRRELAFIGTTANQLGVNVGSLTDAYKDFSAATRGSSLEGERSREIFLSVTQAARTLGLSTESTTGALRALSQMASGGTVQMDELRGELANHLPGALAIASRAMGVSTGELRKLVESGTLAADEFLPKFARQLRSEMGEATEAVTQGAAANFARLGNAIDVMVKQAAASGLIEWIGRVAGSFAGVVLRADEAMQKIKDFARQKVGADIAGRTGGGPSDNPSTEQKLNEILERRAVIEQRLRDLNKESLSGRPSAARDRLIKNAEVSIADLTRQYKELLDTVQRLRLEPNIDMAPFLAEGEKRSAIGAKLKEIAEGAKAISEGFELVADPVAKARKELDFLQDSMQKILTTQGKKTAKGGFELGLEAGSPSEKMFTALVSRARDLEAFITRTKASKEEEKDYADAIRDVAAAHEQKIQTIMKGLTDERQALRMSTDVLELYELGQAKAGEGVLRQAQRLQGHIRALRDDKAALDELMEAERILFEGAGPREGMAERMKVMQEYQTVLGKAKDDTQKVWDDLKRGQVELGRTVLGFVDGLVGALQRGGDAWRQFGDEVVRQMLRIAIEKGNVEQKLGEWLQKGVGAVISLFSAASGAPVTDASAAGLEGEGLLWSMNTGRAAGGPVTAGKAYVVGEGGKPELFIPGTSGAIINNSASQAYVAGATMMSQAHAATYNSATGGSSSNVVHQAAPVIHVHINAMDAGSVIRSRAEISRAIGQAVQASTRHS